MNRPSAGHILQVALAAVIVLSWAAAVAWGENPAVCRVIVTNTTGGRCYGSGTLVYKDASQGIVLTCAHLFRGEEVAGIGACFPAGGCRQAELIAIDQAWDLTALKIAPPAADPVTIAIDHPKPGDRLQSCGYGCDGRYWCNQGRAKGYVRTATTKTYETLTLSGWARDGDSGGPVFNVSGELVAVLWGTDGRIVDGTYCGRIRKFLAGLLGRGRPVTVPPLPTPGPLAPVDPVEIITPDKPAPPLPGPAKVPVVDLSTIQAQIESLKTQLGGIAAKPGPPGKKGERGDRGPPGDVAPGATPDTPEEPEPAISGDDLGPGALPVVLPIALTALGLSGATPAVLAGLAGLRWWRRRRSKKPKGGSAPADANFPPSGIGTIPRDDSEAAQLVRLAELEGRSPLHDAVVGMFAFDELNDAVESGGPEGTYAAKLRRRLEDRFNKVAPASVQT